MADLRNTRHSVAARNAWAAAIVALVDGGRIRIYSGSQPAPGGNPTGTLLWESPVLPIPAFGAPSNGIAALVAPQTELVVNTDTPTNFTVFDSSDQPVWNGTVGQAGGADQHNIEVNDDDFVVGAEFTLNTLTYEAKAQGN